VIGTLRPVILLPASTLTGLTPQQIEMVLAHELAHIRRHDFLVNLLQAVVETLMFYHPAVWWMSRRVRIERENCCDDMAVAVCGNPIQYARALTRLEELRSASMSIVVAANGGSLIDRIRRIAMGRAESTGNSSRWAAAVAVLSIVAIAMAVPSLPAFATRDEPAAKTNVAKATEPAAKTNAAKATEPASEVEVTEAAPAPEPDAAGEATADPDENYEIDWDDLDVEPMVMPAPTPVPPAPGVPAIAAVPPAMPAPRARPARTPRPVAPMPPGHRQVAWMMDDDDGPDHDEDVDRSRKIGKGGKLTVDELIELRAVDVTPDYIDQMRQIFPDLTLGELVGMRAVGVTPDYVRKMREVGLDVPSANKAQSLRALDVTPEYVREIRAAGVDLKSSKDAQSMRALGVTAQFVRQLAEAGYSNLSVREITRLAAAGIDGDFIREMSKYRDKN
jgi:beta-lactamase regulating signal transducer with metallopeptidase domain